MLASIQPPPREITSYRRSSQRTLALGLAHGPIALLVLQLCSFYAFVLRARLALGHWPQPYRPDPKLLDFPVHSHLVLMGAVLTVWSPVFAILLLAVAKRLGLPRQDLRPAALLFSACYLAGLALFLLDPGRFGEWFMD